MAYSKSKNLLKSRDTYNRYYGDFRGVDFSNDHTQVIEQRLAYSVNMYKDYQSGQGKALETIPGFRRRVALPEKAKIYGIHYFKIKDNENDILRVIIHAGTKLYLWNNYPNSINVTITETVELDESRSATLKNAVSIVGVYMLDGTEIDKKLYFYNLEEKKLTMRYTSLAKGDLLYVKYNVGVFEDALFEDMNERNSESFIFNNRLYIIDGKNYLVYDGNTVASVLDTAYVPTTYQNIVLSGEQVGKEKQYEHANFLQPQFINTFIPDGLTAAYPLYDRDLEEDSETVEVYGVKKTKGEHYDVDYEKGVITFKKGNIPPVNSSIADEINGQNESENGEGEESKPKVNGNSNADDITNANKFPKLYAGVKITASKKKDEYKETIVSEITNCTLVTIFDNRVFLSGNPNHPNKIYWCGENSVAGAIDPSYFPLPFFESDGVGITGVTGMLVVADTLLVLKGDTQQDGSVYYHTATSTGDDLYPKIYPSSRGLAGTGCVGACVNFLDDPIFISRLGVEGVSQLKIASERNIEHRSSLVDAKLVNMNLKDASIEEWNGYLIVLVDGAIFMADSRQRYANEIGVVEYEWYYLENIGVYENQYQEYFYSSDMPNELEDFVIDSTYPLMLAPENLRNMIVNPPNEDGNSTVTIKNAWKAIEVNGYQYKFYFDYALVNNEAYLCESKGNYTGGVFDKARIVKTLDGNIFFGTDAGVICSFNFDKRNELGEIPSEYYSFDERTIHCGCATKMDNCGVPHLTKKTVKKSMVVKTKSFQTSAAKIKVRTNKKTYNQIARINSTLFSFENMDFTDFSFITTEQSLFSVREKEKQWVEKQYYIYSDEYLKPFALYYISFRYNISGRYKE